MVNEDQSDLQTVMLKIADAAMDNIISTAKCLFIAHRFSCYLFANLVSICPHKIVPATLQCIILHLNCVFGIRWCAFCSRANKMFSLCLCLCNIQIILYKSGRIEKSRNPRSRGLNKLPWPRTISSISLQTVVCWSQNGHCT